MSAPGFAEIPFIGITAVVADAAVKCTAQPDAALTELIYFLNSLNLPYGGRDQLLPSDYPKK